MYQIKTYNAIAKEGLDTFKENYQVNTGQEPDAYMIRSIDLHDHQFEPGLLAIARCGAGFNNIPLDACSEQGIAVFNTPGGNANAVKEVVIALMVIANRNLIEAANWSAQNVGEDISLRTEREKSRFNGHELFGKRLAVIGMGHVGSLVANAAIDLGMDVIGYDPYLSVDAAWNLTARVQRAATLADAVKGADFITVHVPKNEETTGMINQELLAQVKPGAILFNYSRLGIVDNQAAVAALANGQLGQYVTDFGEDCLQNNPKVTITPHLGGSTKEAEINCAKMAVDELTQYLETGNTTNAVNLPDVVAPFTSQHRFTIIHRNIPNMLGQISTAIAKAEVNIDNLVNRAKGEYAYTMVDVGELTAEQTEILTTTLNQIDAVSRVRLLDRPLP